jgi:hypothetical protein
MFSPRRHSIEGLLPGENGQFSKMPNWIEKSAREETNPVELREFYLQNASGEILDKHRLHRSFVIAVNTFRASILLQFWIIVLNAPQRATP